MALLLEYNKRCVPPWTENELRHKLEAAVAGAGDVGTKLREPSARTIEVGVRPGDSTVVVVVGCRSVAGSYMDLLPDLWAGMLKHGTNYSLAPQLAALDWKGKTVFLAPPSTVLSNQKVVLDEFRLAEALRERGATVECFRPTRHDGRRRTYGQGLEWVVSEPPHSPGEAKQAALKAKQTAIELSSQRRSQPRKKRSPTLEKAIAFLDKHSASQLTRQLVNQGKRRQLSESTLRRALILRNNKE
jgi:hypothetical protein